MLNVPRHSTSGGWEIRYTSVPSRRGAESVRQPKAVEGFPEGDGPERAGQGRRWGSMRAMNTLSSMVESDDR